MLTKKVINKDFWKSAGMHLVKRNEFGWLDITKDYMRAYFTRPEIHPIEDSCEAEHQIFEALMEDPLQDIAETELLKIKDQDTLVNYQTVLRFRDHCVFHKTVEKAYKNIFDKDKLNIPPMFIDQMVHLILRNILVSEADPILVKTAELFFREQKVTTSDGQLMLADQEIIEMKSESGGFGGLGELLVNSGIPTREVIIDVLTDENKDSYWERSDKFDTAIDFRFTQPAPDAFAKVIQKWIEHLTGVKSRVQAVKSIRDQKWSWHIGLDPVSTHILNSLYEGKQLDDNDIFPIIGLFRIEILDQDKVVESMKGKPVYLALAMNRENIVKMKPQNLITNLPVKTATD